MTQPEQDHYAVLDVSNTATPDEIKRRYRHLMRAVHPDANIQDPDATRKAARINRAFETLGNAERRREYDLTRRARTISAATAPRTSKQRADRKYSVWAEQPDWEDIVAANVPTARPAHVHSPEPLISPKEIEVHMSELNAAARVKRTISVTNNCDCVLRGDVSTSEPWLWGPIGRFEVGPRATIQFDIDVISRKVAFPGISRVLFVTREWTGIVPVKITGYEPKQRRVPPSSDMSYVRTRRQKWANRR